VKVFQSALAVQTADWKTFTDAVDAVLNEAPLSPAPVTENTTGDVQ
jgi:hypothetical protein